MNKSVNVADLLREGKSIEEIMAILKANVDEAAAAIKRESETIADRVTAGTATIEDAIEVMSIAVSNEFPNLGRALKDGILDKRELGAASEMRDAFRALDRLVSSFDKLEAATKATPTAAPAVNKVSTPTPAKDVSKSLNEMSVSEADAVLRKFLGM